MKSGELLLEITPQVLLKAYACGIFPMAESADHPALYWIEPDTRGIIPLNEVHLSRSLAKTIRKQQFEVKIDNNFKAVINNCAKPGQGRQKTWINDRIKTLYTDLFNMGHCHTIEVWKNGKLAGGLYGVRLGGAFFGESMFHNCTDASKIALIYLIARLKAGGFCLLDTQFITAHLSTFGAIEIKKEDYQKKLDAAMEYIADFHSLAADSSPDDVLQLVSQTS